MLNPSTNFREVFRQQAEKAVRKLTQGAIRVLSYLGEQCVNHARTVDTYRDQTGNLRNSIGYVIVRNGEILKSNFQQSVTNRNPKTGRFESGKTGTQVAKELANQLINDFASEGWGLIVVAGMNYALAVESRGLDVLTTAEQLAKSELPNLLRQLQIDVNKSA
ncbi:hypothetical protein GO755_34905 [Spirosoma sp. HMF4905]|uniref:HK97 gp10 family phage protein n=1 Tax=Spirosoma arboris TaxID=2682092 RepID=A0A7K1SN86_9BACT|nr:hypothetical protein [Spirosoma arboris]MVM35264.1 hypothetical protein [Spirosoma arboris]